MAEIYTYALGVGRIVHIPVLDGKCCAAVVTAIDKVVFSITVFGPDGPLKEFGLVRTTRAILAEDSWHPADHCPTPTRMVTRNAN